MISVDSSRKWRCFRWLVAQAAAKWPCMTKRIISDGGFLVGGGAIERERGREDERDSEGKDL